MPWISKEKPLEGWAAFLLGDTFWYFAEAQNYHVFAYIFSALGVLVIALVHTQVWQKNPEFYKHLLSRQK